MAGRLIGAVVLLLSLLPLFRLIRVDRSGPWGAQTVAQAADAHDLTLWGGLVVVGVGVLTWIWARRQDRERAEEPATRTGPEPPGAPSRVRSWAERACAAPIAAYSLVLGVLSAGLAAVTSTWVFGRLLSNVDEMTSLIHARYWAAGVWGGPLGEVGESFMLPNMLEGPAGWVSQYPPGHLALLAVGAAWGSPWIVGPTLLGIMVACSAFAFDQLSELGERSYRTEVRVAALLLAVSPFMLLMGAGAMSHLSAGAAGAAALAMALRARTGNVLWAAGAGAAMGVMVLSRPWTGLMLGTALTLGVWVMIEPREGLFKRVGLWVLGGVPFAVLLGWFNQRMWGAPTRLGYEVLYGPDHKLGLHSDPWGYEYGALEALAYTSADLVRFGSQLLDTPLAVPVVVGITLLFVRRRLGPAFRVALLWALVPLVANAAYWFHQPRMLLEGAPGWLLLAALGTGVLVRDYGRPVRVATWVAAGLALVVGATIFAPARFAATGWSDETLASIRVPALPGIGMVTVAQLPQSARALGGEEATPTAPIVFVHTSWNERIAARFQALGVRGDSLQSLVRRNDQCALERLARRGRGLAVDPAGAALDGTIDRTHTGAPRPDLNAVVIPGGVTVSRLGEALWSAECAQQVEADRFGAVSLAPLLWQGDLPGLPVEGAMYVRDYGPEWNARVLAAHPGRSPHLFTPTEEGGRPQIVDYDEGMRVLWGG